MSTKIRSRLMLAFISCLTGLPGAGSGEAASAPASKVVARGSEPDKADISKTRGANKALPAVNEIWVHNGTPVLINEASYTVQIAYKNPLSEEEAKPYKPWQLQHICGGALVAPNWVLTAAHCMAGKDFTKPMEIRLASRVIDLDPAPGENTPSTKISLNGQVDHYVLHSGYYHRTKQDQRDKYQDDLALVHFTTAEPVIASQLDVIGIFDGSPLKSGADVAVEGWGLTESTDLIYSASATLLRGKLKLISHDDCSKAPYQWRKYYRDDADRATFVQIHEKLVCAGGTSASSCHGDSGGPLVTEGLPRQLIGIVSFNRRAGNCVPTMRPANDSQGDAGGANNAAFPGGYTNVARYSDWIKAAMKTTAATGKAQCLTEPVAGMPAAASPCN